MSDWVPTSTHSVCGHARWICDGEKPSIWWLTVASMNSRVQVTVGWIRLKKRVHGVIHLMHSVLTVFFYFDSVERLQGCYQGCKAACLLAYELNFHDCVNRGSVGHNRTPQCVPLSSIVFSLALSFSVSTAFFNPLNRFFCLLVVAATGNYSWQAEATDLRHSKTHRGKFCCIVSGSEFHTGNFCLLTGWRPHNMRRQ